MVLSVTIKVHPDFPLTFGFLNFSGAPPEAHWKAIAAYNVITPDLTNSQAFSLALYSNVSFSITPLAILNKTEMELTAMLRPLLETLEDFNIQYNFSIRSGLRYLDGLKLLGAIFPNVGNLLVGSRLLPRSLWANGSGMASVLDASRELTDAGFRLIEFSLKLPTRLDGDPQNAVLPAWREAHRLVNPTL